MSGPTMKKHLMKSFAAGVCAAAILPSTAVADVSSSDVWNMWKTKTESAGQKVTVGSQDNNGSSIVLHNVTVSNEAPTAKSNWSIELLEFRDLGDGTVSVTMSPDIPVSISNTPKNDIPAFDLAFIVHQSDLKIIASGMPDDIKFAYTAGKIDVVLNKLIADGDDSKMDLSIALNDISGQYGVRSSNRVSFDSTMSAGSLTYAYSFPNPDGRGTLEAKGSLADVKTTSNGLIPVGLNISDDPKALFSSDFEAMGSITAGPSQSELKFDDGKTNLSTTSSAQSSSLDFQIGNGSVGYGGTAAGAIYKITGSELPFPEINMSLEKATFNLLMPITQTEDARDFKFKIGLEGLNIDDAIWNMFDPGTVMPRDPLTLIIDTKGKFSWLIDLFKPEDATADQRDQPIRPEEFKINEIRLSAVGAEISGTGAFTFNNDDLETFGGFPAPTGEINLNINGANGLLDKLVQMGFVPDDQAMSARMMLGLFARPAGGEDAMTSQIKIEGDGSIFANGQQLR